MTDSQLTRRTIEVVSRVFDVPVDSLSESSSPETVEPWDSLTHMNLVLALEEEFGVSLSDDQIVTLVDVRSILSTLSALGAK